MALMVNNFPGNCGMRIITGFPILAGDIEPVLADLRSFEKRYKSVCNQFIITLNGWQDDIYRKDLLEEGYSLVSSNVRNPNTGNDLFTYIKVLRKKNRRSKWEVSQSLATIPEEAPSNE